MPQFLTDANCEKKRNENFTCEENLGLTDQLSKVLHSVLINFFSNLLNLLRFSPIQFWIGAYTETLWYCSKTNCIRVLVR